MQRQSNADRTVTFTATQSRGRVPIVPVTQGRPLLALSVSAFQLTAGTYTPGRRLARHAHERAAVTIVTAGSFTEIFGSRRYTCAPWSVLIKPAAEAHADVYGSAGASCLFIEGAADWMTRFDAADGLFGRVSFLPPPAACSISRRLHREVRTLDEATPLAVEGLLLELFAEVTRWPEARADSDAPPWLRRATELIHDAFGSTLRISDIAAHAGVHPVSLARAFRRRYGRSPGEYLRDVRLKWARDALLRGSWPVARIAVTAGFSDQSHFARVFTRRFGTPPSRYRLATQS